MLTIIVFGLIAACAEVIGGLIIIARRSWPQQVQEVLLALGAGFLLALVFIKLIPASIATLGDSAALYILAGFAAIHFFEHTAVGHLHFGEEVHADVMVSHIASLSTFAGLVIHAFFDGFSISVGMQFDWITGVLLFLAILLHKLPEGLTIGSVMLSAGRSRRTIILATLGLAGATLMGICIALLFSINQYLLGVAFAFSAGAAGYVGASDLIPEINKSPSRIPPLVVFLGMVLFYGTERLLTAMMEP